MWLSEICFLAKLAEQQKKEVTDKIKNRISKQTHIKKVAESFKLFTSKFTEANKTKSNKKKPEEVFKKTDSENETAHLAIEKLTIKHFLNQIYKKLTTKHTQGYYLIQL